MADPRFTYDISGEVEDIIQLKRGKEKHLSDLATSELDRQGKAISNEQAAFKLDADRYREKGSRAIFDASVGPTIAGIGKELIPQYPDLSLGATGTAATGKAVPGKAATGAGGGGGAGVSIGPTSYDNQAVTEEVIKEQQKVQAARKELQVPFDFNNNPGTKAMIDKLPMEGRETYLADVGVPATGVGTRADAINAMAKYATEDSGDRWDKAVIAQSQRRLQIAHQKVVDTTEALKTDYSPKATAAYKTALAEYNNQLAIYNNDLPEYTKRIQMRPVYNQAILVAKQDGFDVEKDPKQLQKFYEKHPALTKYMKDRDAAGASAELERIGGGITIQKSLQKSRNDINTITDPLQRAKALEQYQYAARQPDVIRAAERGDADAFDKAWQGATKDWSTLEHYKIYAEVQKNAKKTADDKEQERLAKEVAAADKNYAYNMKQIAALKKVTDPDPTILSQIAQFEAANDSIAETYREVGVKYNHFKTREVQVGHATMVQEMNNYYNEWKPGANDQAYVNNVYRSFMKAKNNGWIGREWTWEKWKDTMKRQGKMTPRTGWTKVFGSKADGGGGGVNFPSIEPDIVWSDQAGAFVPARGFGQTPLDNTAKPSQ